jgi:hypothetical protein
VTEDRRQLHRRKAATPIDEVAPAHTRGAHSNENLSGARLGIRRFAKVECLRAADSLQHDGAHDAVPRYFFFALSGLFEESAGADAGAGSSELDGAVDSLGAAVLSSPEMLSRRSSPGFGFTTGSTFGI